MHMATLTQPIKLEVEVLNRSVSCRSQGRALPDQPTSAVILPAALAIVCACPLLVIKRNLLDKHQHLCLTSLYPCCTCMEDILIFVHPAQGRHPCFVHLLCFSRPCDHEATWSVHTPSLPACAYKSSLFLIADPSSSAAASEESDSSSEPIPTLRFRLAPLPRPRPALLPVDLRPVLPR